MCITLQQILKRQIKTIILNMLFEIPHILATLPPNLRCYMTPAPLWDALPGALPCRWVRRWVRSYRHTGFSLRQNATLSIGTTTLNVECVTAGHIASLLEGTIGPDLIFMKFTPRKQGISFPLFNLREVQGPTKKSWNLNTQVLGGLRWYCQPFWQVQSCLTVNIINSACDLCL